jgi:hypothetical protein
VTRYPLFWRQAHYRPLPYQNLIVYPVANGTMINFAAFYHQPDKVGTVFEGPWVAHVSKEELQTAYAGWEPSVQAWLQVRWHFQCIFLYITS